jgi:uncharacterized membrane protein YccC
VTKPNLPPSWREGEQRRLRHRHHRHIEQLASGAQAAVPRHRDQDRVAARRVARHQVDRGMLADRHLGVAGDHPRAEAAGDRHDLGAGARHRPHGVRDALGDEIRGVGVEDQKAHRHHAPLARQGRASMRRCRLLR